MNCPTPPPSMNTWRVAGHKCQSARSGGRTLGRAGLQAPRRLRLRSLAHPPAPLALGPNGTRHSEPVERRSVEHHVGWAMMRVREIQVRIEPPDPGDRLGADFLGSRSTL
jgi:hypothetical protein